MPFLLPIRYMFPASGEKAWEFIEMTQLRVDEHCA